MLQSSPGLLLIRDELLGWVKSFDAYRPGGDYQFWIEAWSSTPIKVDRKSSITSIYLPTPVLGVIGGIQPDRLRDIQQGPANDGFIERILWAWPDAQAARWTEAVVSPEVLDAMLGIFTALRSGPVNPSAQVVQLSTKARHDWVDWFNLIQVETMSSSGVMSGFAAKLPSHVIRLALVLHLLSDPYGQQHVLQDHHLTAALDLGDYFRDNLRRVAEHLGPSQVKALGSLAQKIMGAVTAGSGDVTRTELHAALGGKAKAADIYRELAVLQAAGRVELYDVSSGGHPANMIRFLSTPSDDELAS